MGLHDRAHQRRPDSSSVMGGWRQKRVLSAPPLFSETTTNVPPPSATAFVMIAMRLSFSKHPMSALVPLAIYLALHRVCCVHESTTNWRCDERSFSAYLLELQCGSVLMCSQLMRICRSVRILWVYDARAVFGRGEDVCMPCVCRVCSVRRYTQGVYRFALWCTGSLCLIGT